MEEASKYLSMSTSLAVVSSECVPGHSQKGLMNICMYHVVTLQMSYMPDILNQNSIVLFDTVLHVLWIDMPGKKRPCTVSF